MQVAGENEAIKSLQNLSRAISLGCDRLTAETRAAEPAGMRTAWAKELSGLIWR